MTADVLPLNPPTAEREGYMGYIDEDGTARVLYATPRQFWALDPRLDLRNHSPDGFQWGYEGSGPAQLALALLADHTRDDELAERHYQEFNRRVVAKLPEGQPWTLTQEQMDDALAQLRAEAVA